MVHTTDGDTYQIVADPGAGVDQTQADTMSQTVAVGRKFKFSHVGYTGSGPFGRVFSPSFKIISHMEPL